MDLTKEQADMALGLLTILAIVIVAASVHFSRKAINKLQNDLNDADEYLDNKTRHEIED